ncbi:hypothetical protein ACHAXS_013724 [Conticribra weissflogii]
MAPAVPRQGYRRWTNNYCNYYNGCRSGRGRRRCRCRCRCGTAVGSSSFERISPLGDKISINVRWRAPATRPGRIPIEAWMGRCGNGRTIEACIARMARSSFAIQRIYGYCQRADFPLFNFLLFVYSEGR